MIVHKCRQTEDPRKPHRCACGKPLLRSARDQAYEFQFLHESASAAERAHGVDAEGFPERVLNRLEIGASRYGDNDFLSKDVLIEALEEAWDLAAYAVLEAQKMVAAGEDGQDKAFHLYEMAKLAAAIEWHARQARIA